MPTRHSDLLLSYIRRLAAVATGSSATDAELLERFVNHRDEVAFTRLLARHGPMIGSVCRRILPDVHSAEDAFQATLHTALCTATVGAAAAGAIPPPAAALAEGVLKSMFMTKLQTALVCVATTLLLAGSACLVHRAPAEPPPIRAEGAKEPKTPVAGFTDAEFKDLKAKLDVHNQPWARIPWQVSLTEARELAAKTKKPIFLAVGTGNPLGWG
jgi:hypothetical protein